MTPDQRFHLAVKRSAHWQRFAAVQYLGALRGETRASLSAARVVVQPEIDPFADYRPFQEHGFGQAAIARPPGCVFSAFARLDEVLSLVERFGPKLDEVAGYFSPILWSALPPVFEVRFGWARLHFCELHAAARQDCGLMSVHGDAGILTRVVCGYWDRPADERVFEVAYWGGNVAEPEFARDRPRD